jgi:hypothetical protein
MEREAFMKALHIRKNKRPTSQRSIKKSIAPDGIKEANNDMKPEALAKMKSCGI